MTHKKNAAKCANTHVCRGVCSPGMHNHPRDARERTIIHPRAIILAHLRLLLLVTAVTSTSSAAGFAATAAATVMHTLQVPVIHETM